ncbi:uncharacterized protein E5676_scaffold124G00320 [Cucumis melo var. makuwa]|uniref:Uncharacterized protein n=1 Tax=Cucumis melo var. makuwa TaxID=1194695 RepID=A0A5D3DTV5_CUCMM|nr:uncharacterized protein E6C27_scaffold67G006640 [Cucumis melo var. makuwa]TYK26745.1 uncharacterized protein E5676_scaffold124G00320 [Cucumis melo var. makuwa]
MPALLAEKKFWNEEEVENYKGTGDSHNPGTSSVLPQGPKNGINRKIVQVVLNKYVWDVPKVEGLENEQLNVLETVVRHRVDEHIKDDTLCRAKVDPIVVERPDVCHVTVNFIDDDDERSSSLQSGSKIMSFPNSFHETDMNLELDDAFNNVRGSSSVGHRCPSTHSHSHIEETSALSELRVEAIRIATRKDLYINRPMRGQAHLATYCSVQHSHYCVNTKHIFDHCPQVG